MKLFLSGIVIFSFFVSCTSTPEPELSPPAEAAPEPAPPPVAMEEEVIPAEEEEKEEKFLVSNEVYEQTFHEIEELIDTLDRIISRRQFERWAAYLSQSYKDKYQSEQFLKEISSYPQLRDNNIVIKNLKDYFDWVVVPSHHETVLGEIVFVSEYKVVAYSTFEGKRALLYQFEKIDNKWKISV